METDPTIRALTRTTKKYYATLVLLAVVIGWGAYALSRILTFGHGETGLSTPVYWGANVFNYVFFIGVSAGGVAVASISHIYGLEKYKPIARLAEISAIIALILAFVFILTDLGRPERFVNILVYGRVWSPFIWNGVVMSSYFLLALAFGYFGTREQLVRAMVLIPSRRTLYRSLALGYTDISERAIRRDRRVLRGLAIAGFVLAIGLHSITGWIFGLVKAEPVWHSALLAPLFVISALVSGLALVVIVGVVTRRLFHLKISNEAFSEMGKLLAYLLPVKFYFVISELLTMVYGQEIFRTVVFQNIVFGPFAYLFWLETIVGLLVPFFILINSRTRTTAGVTISAVLVIVGVFANRIDLIVPPLLFPLLPYPQGFYIPTWVELSVWGGIYSLGVLIYGILIKVLPIVDITAKLEQAKLKNNDIP